MARLFSIFFEHKGLPFTAMISVRTTPFFTEYVLTQLDEELICQLPGNKIIATPNGTFIFENNPATPASPLMESILKAVVSHLQASEV
jgi:hypothetical protein